MIKKSACDTHNCARELEFYISARAAWSTLLGGLKFDGEQSILLPAYIGITEREGSGIVDPVNELAVPHSFYPLGPRLEIDPEDMEQRLASGRHPLLLIVHYFGLVHGDLARLRDLCRRSGTLLVEDCAHVTSLTEDIGVIDAPGSVGDAAFYSIHKAIAVDQGGILRFNGPAFPRTTPDPSVACPPAVLGQLLRTDMPSVARLRRRNYQWLCRRLADVEGLSIAYPDPGPLVPHDFPVLIRDGFREKLYFMLLDEGLPTIALYYRLIEEIDRGQFPLSYDFSAAILNLPVHQDIRIQDLAHLADRLEVLLAGLHR